MFAELEGAAGRAAQPAARQHGGGKGLLYVVWCCLGLGTGAGLV